MKKVTKSPGKQRAPALTPEARENQLIALAVDCVEERMRTGKASAQEYIHFLKLATTKEQLEVEKLRRENELLVAKRESLEASNRMEELYTAAMAAMKSYSGTSEDENPAKVVLGID